jgi:hypothetical protein
MTPGAGWTYCLSGPACHHFDESGESIELGDEFREVGFCVQAQWFSNIGVPKLRNIPKCPQNVPRPPKGTRRPKVTPHTPPRALTRIPSTTYTHIMVCVGWCGWGATGRGGKVSGVIPARMAAPAPARSGRKSVRSNSNQNCDPGSRQAGTEKWAE